MRMVAFPNREQKNDIFYNPCCEYKHMMMVVFGRRIRYVFVVMFLETIRNNMSP